MVNLGKKNENCYYFEFVGSLFSDFSSSSSSLSFKTVRMASRRSCAISFGVCAGITTGLHHWMAVSNTLVSVMTAAV